MSLKSRARVLAAFVAVVVALASASVAAEKKSKKKMPRGMPVMWRNHKVESLDLFDGPGGKSGRPDLRRLRLIKSEEGGYSPKFRVRDASGREWVAKLGPEAQSETAAVRLVWAGRYVTVIKYPLPCAAIPAASPTQK